jgi:DNA invertase Pin-like site-specific DNA recombinase
MAVGPADMHELVRLVAGLHHRQVGLHALGDGLDTRSGDGRLVFPVFAALADLVRDGRATGAREAGPLHAPPGSASAAHRR